MGIWNVSLHIQNPVPAERWSLMVGDIINNLRSALDHSVYALAIVGSKLDPPPAENQMQFPILLDSSKFPTAQKSSLRNIPPTAVQIIQNVQPFGDQAHTYGI